MPEPAVERLALELLALPVSARADLAHRLTTSLDQEHDPEAPELWLEEIRRRNAQIDAGTAQTIPADVLFERLRASLRK